ncbi:type II secretion system protein GspC [Serratia oryzae]|uniref:Type II secretion system protein GspC n=2 Tax=Serratia oryzae TaxID=2034155 RepID=A0A1S8CFN8_9GAMM|nr:type II secretion system protein GspC [Serratia oryzae]
MVLSIRETAFKMLTPRWVLCVVMLLACNQLAMLTWQIWLPAEQPAVSLAKAAVPQAAAVSNEAAATYRFNLFGTAAPSSAPAATAVSDSSLHNAPPSALKINLTGIVASPTPAHSIAIIAKDSKQFSLGIGDNTPGYDAKIAAIFADRVVINYQGRYESLLLFGDASPAAAKAPSEKKASAGQLKAQLQKQPQNILTYLNISPVMVDNKLTGYRLNPGVQGELFQQVGLRENDLAVALNGLDLRDAQQAQQALKQLPELSELNLTVERDGQLHDIYVALGDN